MEREVEVNWLGRGESAELIVQRRFGWAVLSPEIARVCEQLPLTKNRNDLTADAAIAAAALLVNDLEGASLTTVLQIGSGGDYLVRIPQLSNDVQIEMSGILEDGEGSASRSRLKQKCEQVLTRARVGFASVTTFSHGPSKIVHSYLHFTKARRKKASRKQRKPRKGKKR